MKNASKQTRAKIFISMDRYNSPPPIGALDKHMTALLPQGNVAVFEQQTQELLSGENRKNTHTSEIHLDLLHGDEFVLLNRLVPRLLNCKA